MRMFPFRGAIVLALVVISTASPAALASTPELKAPASHAQIARALVAHLQSAPPVAAHPQVIGGGNAPTGAFPYAVYVEASYTLDGQPVLFHCTGSLVSPTVVLTAGHCIHDSTTGQVLPAGVFGFILGLSDLSAPIPMENIRFASTVVPYPYHDQATGQGDVALLVLETTAPPGAVPIALATSANASLYAAGQPATVLGWGATSNTPSTPDPDILQAGTVAVQANATCSALAPSVLPYHPGLDLCAAAPGYVPAACYGDSGGPLVANTAVGPVEIGIVSYGNELCATGPDFYARASSIQPWVAAVLAGGPAPPPFVPPFAAPVATATLVADGVTIAFPAPAADPATLPTGFTVTLVNAAGAVVGTQNLPAGVTTAAFPALQPGSYAAAVTAAYSEGVSAAGISNPVSLSPPSNSQRPAIKGRAFVGSTLTCQTGAWVWPGASTLATAWLRNGQATVQTKAAYKVGAADAGKKLACRVTLIATTGPQAVASSPTVLAAVKLRAKSLPSIAGSRALGQALTCSAGSWAHTGALKVKYRWLRNGKPIAGATGTSRRHVVAPADVGRRLACRVSVSTAGQKESKTTPAFAVQAGV